MSAQPSEPTTSAVRTTGRLVVPSHPLTVAEYLELGEIEPGRTELVEGQLMMAASPVPRHNRAQKRLMRQLDAVMPPELDSLAEMDVELALSGPDGPGWVRMPDIVVAPRAAWERVDREGGVLSASDVVLVVEIISRSTRRTDRITKCGEYADAGIPHYWVVDLDDPVSMTLHHSAGEFGYADGGVVTGTYSATTPFPVELDLDALV
jgi:Uma2 family endonuclease